MKKTSKAQTAIELLIVLGASLTILLVFFSLSSQYIVDLNREKQTSEAKLALELLKNAANDVYFQGVGAQQQVFYAVPSDVNQDGSGIVNDFFVLKIYGSELFSRPLSPLAGTLPASPGGHTVWLIAQDTNVLVSESEN